MHDESQHERNLWWVSEHISKYSCKQNKHLQRYTLSLE